MPIASRAVTPKPSSHPTGASVLQKQTSEQSDCNEGKSESRLNGQPQAEAHASEKKIPILS